MCLVSQHQVVSQKSVPCGDRDAQMLVEGHFGRISLYHSSDQLLRLPVKGEVSILLNKIIQLFSRYSFGRDQVHTN